MLLFLIAFILSGSTSAQSMYVKQHDKTQTVYSINEIQKLTFNSGNLVITPVTGTPDQVPLQDLRYISFVDYVEIDTGIYVKECETGHKITLYPNPVKDILELKIENGNLYNVSYQIFNINGQLMSQSSIHANNTQIDMTPLSSAVYLLTVRQNDREIQTFKIVKQ